MIDEPSGPVVSRTFRSAVAADFRASTWLQRFLLVGVVAWLAYEWGAGNETFTPWFLVKVVTATEGAWSIIATAAAGFAFTMCQQLLSGFTTSAGFARFSRTADAAWQRLSARTESETLEWSKMGWATRALVVFSLGTTAVVLIQVAVTGEVGVARHRRTVIEAAALCGAIVGLIGGIIAAMVWGGRSVPALNTLTDALLRITGNPLLWIAILLLLLLGQSRRAAARQSSE